jgi:hypothetical protein
MDLDTTNLDTADLVLQTALQDVEELLGPLACDKTDGNGRIHDPNCALLQWRTELQTQVRTQQDRRTAIQISRQSRSDQATILRDIHTREMNEAPAARGPSPQARSPTRERPTKRPRCASDLIPAPGAQLPAPRRVDATSTSTVPTSGILRECIACLERNSEGDMIQNGCSHFYCRGCVIHLLQTSLVDESLFPPRCCRLPLPMEATRGIIDDGLWARFEEKTIEHGDQSRTYCLDPACSRYILPAHIRGTIGTCRSCNRKSCTLCKKIIHRGDCVDDFAEVLELARAEGWQRCPNCSHIVELRSGCNHIT